MKISYDPEVDALYISLREAPVDDSADLEDGVTVDLDADGRLIGIEILDARHRLGSDPLDSILIERLVGGQEKVGRPL